MISADLDAHVSAKPRSTAVWETVTIALVLLLAIGLRWDRLGMRNLWADEALSLALARESFPALLADIRLNDTHPLGYYALLSIWIRAFGEDLATMRALSALFGIAAVVLIWRIGRRLFSPAIGVGAAALLALNPFQIFASNELRMYMPLEFLALVSTWLLWRAHDASSQAAPGRYGWWAVYGVSLASMAYVSYYAFLLIPAHAVWILLHHPPRRAVAQMAVAFATALVLYAPWIPFLAALPAFLRSLALVTLRGQSFGPTYLPELVASQTFGGYLFNIVSYHNMQGLDIRYHALLVYPFIVLIAAGAFALGGRNRPARNLVALSWIIPVAVAILASIVLGNVAAYPYHLNFLTPFLALFVAAGAVHLREAVAKAPASLVTLGVVVGILTYLAPAVENLQWNADYQYFRYDSAARLVKNLYQPGDVVVFLPLGVDRGFHFYFDPPGKELGVSLDRARHTRDALRDSIREVGQSLTLGDRRVWLVYSPPIPAGSLEDLLEAIEQQGYKRAVVNDFKGLSVGLFVRPVR